MNAIALNNYRALPVPAEGGLSRYLDRIKRFPVLEAEEEYMLAKRWREHGDLDSAHRLVTSHLRLVAKIALGFRHYGLPVGDLIAEGNIGLMQAVKKFEPDRGFRLATYAMWWIKAAITEFVLSSWSLVKIGTAAAQKKLFFNLRRLKREMNILDGVELTDADARAIADKLEVQPDEAIRMNRRLVARDSSLNVPLAVGETHTEWQDLLEDESASPEEAVAENEERVRGHALIQAALARLSERDRTIFVERRLKDEPTLLEELGARYGVSRERIRQIEVKAFEKVSAFVKANAEKALTETA